MRLVKLRLVRTPGIKDGFTLEPAPGINLVTGPNGVGKSSVCRAVLNLVWPGANSEEPFEAQAEFEIEARRLVVTRQDLDPSTWNGPKPDLGGDHLATRYRMGVLELLQPTDQDDPLAREIRRHMAGGFDLEIIGRELFTTEKGRKESNALKSASERVAKLRAEQRALAAEQNQLTAGRTTRDLAVKARDRKLVLEMIRDLADQATTAQAAAARLLNIPAAAEQVRADDPDRLKLLRRLEKELSDRITKRTAALAVTEKALTELNSSPVLADGLPLDLLKKKRDTLTSLRSEVRQAERDANDPRLAEILEAPPKSKPAWPFVAATVVGAALVAASFLVPLPSGPVPRIVFGLGMAVGAIGIWGWVFRPGDTGQTALILEKKREQAHKQDVLETCRRQWNEALADFNTPVTQAGLPAVADLEEAIQLLDDSEDHRTRLRELQARRTGDEEFLERERKELTERQAEIRAIFDRLALADDRDSDPEVGRLVEIKPAFEQAARDRDRAENEMARLREGIEAGGPLLRDGETPAMPAEILAELISRESHLAEGLGALEKDIARIEAAIERAQGGYDLQEATFAREAAHTALLEMRQSQREAALGRMLLDRVAQRHELESRPLVLEKADEFFQLFTGHRYELKMAAQGQGGDRFLAMPEDSVQPLELAKLSDGTRAQLLLAVKLAFITAGEQGARPPIFMDDSLTSADPERFAAVAASLGRLSHNEGRQVFYLTPNPSDAAAFQRALAGAGLPSAHHIDLAAVRGAAGAADPALLDAANLPADIMAPDPANMNAGEYAKALRVPRPDPWAKRGALHVWYLADDNLDLVRRLIDGNAASWTRFRKTKDTLEAAGIVTATEAAGIEALGELWSAWLDGWRIGRSRPVTRRFLQESAAVTKAYTEPVAAVLEECGWDGACLLEAIEGKKVKGFRAQKLAQLRQELEDADLLDPRVRLTDDELITHTVDRVSHLLASGHLDMQKVRTKALTFSRLVNR